VHFADHNDSTVTLHLPDPGATDALGSALAKQLGAGGVIWLEGDLGAGKTALVRAALRTLGHRGPVKSPSYAILELYAVSSLYCYHFDFYRFNEPEEFLDAGLSDYFRAGAVCFVEWPEKAAGYVPDADLCIRLTVAGEGRVAVCEARSEKGRSWLQGMTQAPAVVALTKA
jgi:tRNA threonylcarbamoyladenosine biosynthesis protein TsaE